MGKNVKLYLSQILNKKVYDEYNQIVGILKDIYVSIEHGYPKVIAYEVKKGRELFSYEFRSVKFIQYKDNIVIKAVDVRDIIPRKYSYLLSRDLLGKKIVDSYGKKIAKVDDLSLVQTPHEIRVVAVNSGLFYRANKLKLKCIVELLHKFIDDNAYNNVIMWENVESLKKVDNNLEVSIPCRKILRLRSIKNN